MSRFARRFVRIRPALLLFAAGMLSAPVPLPARAAEAPVTPEAAGLAAAYLSGRHAEATADSVGAVRFFNRARDLDPNNQRLVEDTYFLAAQVGDFVQAIPAARRAYVRAPRRGVAPVILAVDAFKRQDYAQAWGFIDKISTQSPNSFALPVLRAWALAPTKTADEAIAELAMLKNFQDTAKLVDLMSGLLNEFYGRKDAALANYDALAGDIENERVSVVRIVAGGYVRLGKQNLAKGMIARYQKARGDAPVIQALAGNLGLDTPETITVTDGMSEALFAASELLILNEPNILRTQIAVAYAQMALYLNPQLNMARSFIGNAHAARGRFDEANAMLMSIRKPAAGYMEAQMQVAENLLRMGKAEESLTVLRAVLKEQPNWPDVHTALGDILRREKRYVEAVQEYTTALKHYGNRPDDIWSVYYARGIAYERAKDWNAAEKDFRKALDLKPGEPSVLNYLGYSYLDRGVNLREARRLIEQAYTKRPDDGYIIDSWGWALYMNGEYDKAVQQLERAIEAAPADATINEHLGDAYWKVGRRNEARFQWQRALGLDLDEDQATAVRAKLEQGLAANR